MNLSQLTDEELMRNTKTLVRQESDLLLTILNHLKEIDRRRLYSDYKQPGLLELAMTELGYPRDQALRRILAMRMMRENPMVEEKIRNCELNLTTIGIVQTLFSQEKKSGKPLSVAEKRNVIERVCGKSTREAQKIVFSMSSAPVTLNEKIKPISADLYELTAVIDDETCSLIENLKGMLAHRHPNISNGELMKLMCNVALAEFGKDKATKSERSSTRDNLCAEVSLASRGDSNISSDTSHSVEVENLVAAPRPKSKAEMRRQIWRRDSGRCTNCGSKFAVEEDHRIPKAKGGAYTLANMRLLCRSCNQRAAIVEFGVRKMQSFLDEGRRQRCAQWADGALPRNSS